MPNAINPATGKPFTPREARDHFLAKAYRLGYQPAPVTPTPDAEGA